MKQIQIICTLDVDNDEYSLLLNKQSGLTLTTLISYALENNLDSVRFDFPAVLLDLGANEHHTD